MKKTLKRFTAVLLSLMLAFGAMPFTAFAATSGDCGTNVHWSLSQDGTLSITGSGEMENYTASTYAPWDEYSDSVTKITVSSGVTKIGNYAFYDLNRVTEVQLSEGLLTVGQYAFAYCESLEEITLPASLTNIVNGAFKDSGIKSVTFLGDSIASIGTSVFNTSSGLSKAKIFIKEGFKVAGTTVDPSNYGSAPFYKNYVGYTNGKSTVYWMNDDGTVLEIDTNVVAGATPTYDGTEPSKDGYAFSGWTPAVAAVAAGNVYAYTATFEQTTTTNAILDFGTGHEALAASFAESKGYTISGSQVTIPYQGATKSEVMDELVFDAISLWSDSLIDEGECLYSMFNLGSKPLSDYENEEELRTELNTASQIASANGDVYYLLWNQPYEGDASVTFTAPHIGTEIVTRNYGSIATDHSEPQPEISFSGVVCNMPQGFSWFTSYTDGDSFPNNRFVGAIEGNTVYYTAAYITAPFSDTDAITVNGAQNSWFVETDAANSPGMYTVIAGVMPSDHTYGEPVWVWDGSTATATFTCSVCQHEESVTSTSVSVSEVQNASPDQNRIVRYSTSVKLNGKTYRTERFVESPFITYEMTDEGVFVKRFVGAYSYRDVNNKLVYYRDITVPDTVPDYYPDEELRGEPIVGVSNGAFEEPQSGRVEKARLVSVHFGNNIETIGDNVFRYCYYLTNVTVGTGLKSVGSGVFSNTNYNNISQTITFATDTANELTYSDNSFKTGSVFVGIHEGSLPEIATAFNGTFIGTDAHTFGNPVWTWNGITSASAKFSCSECDFEETVEATVTQNADKISYTATVVYNGVTYTDVKYKEEPTNSYSITVENGVEVNFYVDVPYYSAEGGQLKYTYIKDFTDESAETEQVTVDVNTLPEMDDGTRKLTLKLAPAQLGQVLEIEVYNAGGENVATISKSVAEYCKTILENDSYANYHAVAQALLNYAQLSKEYFDYDDGTELEYDAEHYKDEVTDNFRSRAHAALNGSIEVSDVTYIALLNPEFRFYLKDVTEDDAKALTVSVDKEGLTAKIVKTEKGVCVSVTGLKASEFEDVFTITVGDTQIEYNGYAYLYTVFNNTNVTDQKLKDLAKGVYRYAKAVEGLAE